MKSIYSNEDLKLFWDLIKCAKLIGTNPMNLVYERALNKHEVIYKLLEQIEWLIGQSVAQSLQLNLK
jgi:hypothetical protein